MSPLRYIALSPQVNQNFRQDQSKGTESCISLIALFSSAIGGFVGGYVCFPFEGLKKRAQVGTLKNHLLYALHPFRLFQGAPAFATSVTLASTSSITVNSLLKASSFYDPSSALHNLSAAIGSGVLGSMIGSTPVENTILVQQKLNVGPIKAIQYMLNQGGVKRLWLAGLPIAFRESGFASIMLYGGPAANKFVMDRTQDKTLSLFAELFVGSIAALLTHPADSLATFIQKHAGKVSTWDAAKTLWTQGQKEGPKGLCAFYPGAMYRVFLFVGCATIIPRAAKTAEDILQTMNPSR